MTDEKKINAEDAVFDEIEIARIKTNMAFNNVMGALSQIVDKEFQQKDVSRKMILIKSNDPQYANAQKARIDTSNQLSMAEDALKLSLDCFEEVQTEYKKLKAKKEENGTK